MEKCIEEQSILNIEGYALAGLVVETRVEACNKRRYRIVVKLNNGEVICSPCLDSNIIENSKKVIEHYKIYNLRR